MCALTVGIVSDEDGHLSLNLLHALFVDGLPVLMLSRDSLHPVLCCSQLANEVNASVRDLENLLAMGRLREKITGYPVCVVVL